VGPEVDGCIHVVVEGVAARRDEERDGHSDADGQQARGVPEVGAHDDERAQQRGERGDGSIEGPRQFHVGVHRTGTNLEGI
jgi:hypothetical protein